MSVLTVFLQAAHRKQTLLITALYKTWPRLTFFYVYVVNYYEVFLPLIQYHFPVPELQSLDMQGIWRTGEEAMVQYETERNEENDVPQTPTEVCSTNQEHFTPKHLISPNSHV